MVVTCGQPLEAVLTGSFGESRPNRLGGLQCEVEPRTRAGVVRLSHLSFASCRYLPSASASRSTISVWTSKRRCSRCCAAGQYIGGPQIKRFEEAFAASVGCEHAVGCNSGTDALILALRGLGIGAGDRSDHLLVQFFRHG